MRLLIATVLYRFNLSLCPESQNWADQKIYALWSKPPLMVTLELPGES
jgi:hypothetical protein